MSYRAISTPFDVAHMGGYDGDDAIGPGFGNTWPPSDPSDQYAAPPDNPYDYENAPDGAFVFIDLSGRTLEIQDWEVLNVASDYDIESYTDEDGNEQERIALAGTISGPSSDKPSWVEVYGPTQDGSPNWVRGFRISSDRYELPVGLWVKVVTAKDEGVQAFTVRVLARRSDGSVISESCVVPIASTSDVVVPIAEGIITLVEEGLSNQEGVAIIPYDSENVNAVNTGWENVKGGAVWDAENERFVAGWNSTPRRLVTFDIDGNFIEYLVDISSLISGIVYDPQTEKYLFPATQNDYLMRCNKDGSGYEAQFVDMGDSSNDIAVGWDINTRHIYVGTDSGIKKISADGGTPTTLFAGTRVWGIAVANDLGKIFFGSNDNKIYSAPLSGGTPTAILTGTSFRQVGYDEVNGKIIFVQTSTITAETNILHRCDPDGSNIERMLYVREDGTGPKEAKIRNGAIGINFAFDLPSS